MNAYLVRAKHASQNSSSTHNCYDSRGSVAVTGCASPRAKKNPQRKRGHQLNGCNDGGGKKKDEQTDVRSFERSYFLTV
jgi:hypothetical protein